MQVNITYYTNSIRNMSDLFSQVKQFNHENLRCAKAKPDDTPLKKWVIDGYIWGKEDKLEKKKELELKKDDEDFDWKMCQHMLGNGW